MIDPDFKVSEGLFFEPSPFLRYFNSVEKKVVIFDEGSESYDRRAWWQIQNVVFNSLLTREGFRENILLITLPVLSDLDQRAIRLSTFLITMRGYNQDKGFSFANIYRLFLLDLLGKTRPSSIQNLYIYKASKKNLLDYETKKKDWNMRKSAENISLLEQLENPETYQKGLKFDDYVRMFKKGIIDTDKFKERLIRLNYNEQDLEYVVNMVNLENQTANIDNKPILKTVFLNDSSLKHIKL